MKHFYSKQIRATLIVMFISTSMFAQQNQDLWSKTTKGITSKDNQIIRKSEPNKAGFYQLDLDRLKARLANAPQRGATTNPSKVIIQFPNADGVLESFRVMEASVMVPEFQAKHPDMRSYVGQGIENPTSTIRFSVTPQGLHAMTLSSKKGTQYIDPYTKNGKNYIVYAKRDLPALDEAFVCEVLENERLKERSITNQEMARNADDGMMRTFRLALACSAEYGNFHGENVGSIQTAMVATMTRINGIFERELSLHMDMIDNTTIIYFGDVDIDPYTNNSGSTMLGENQTEITTKIGTDGYDIGHVFSTGGGGVATLGSPCNTTIKARGVTGLTSPVGDPFDVDFVAHEMGHQYGANHTFNGSTGNCSGGNRNASTAYEPGSGSTIMAYAGICSPQDVQQNSDDYFHQASLQEIWANIDSGGASDCGELEAKGNSAPTAEAGASYTIPVFTPYKLTGSSTDIEPIDTHTFTWEQWDLTITAGIPTIFDAEGPLVRSFEGTDNPVRYIPRLEDLAISGGSTTWEKLSVLDNREIDFQLTVRDNDSRGGQTATDDMKVTTTSSSGPFLVTSQSVANTIIWTPSTTETVTWDVASTDVGAVSAANVNILLSTDGGLTFPHVLASSTPNDGSQDITVPNVSGAYCRVMVEGDGNIFFNINNEDFAVGNYTYEAMDVCDDYLFNANIAVPEDALSYSGYVLNVPDSETISDMDINVNITHNDNLDLLYAYRAPFESSPTIHQLASRICSGAVDVDLTFDDEGSAVNCGSTNNGDNVIPQTALSIMDGQDSAGDWIFFITDVNVDDGDIATWNTTTLTICHSELVPTLGVNDFNFEDSFSVYPNPNNGEFTVKLNSNSGNNIKMSVYDIRGRRVFDNIYSNTSNFNEVINLGSVQSGLYILKVTDGNKSGTKKIIIK